MIVKNVLIWKIHTRGWHVPDCRALLFPFSRYLESQGDLCTMIAWKSKKMLMANHSSGSSQPNHHLHEGWMHQDIKSWLSPRVIITCHFYDHPFRGETGMLVSCGEPMGHHRYLKDYWQLVVAGAPLLFS